MKNIVLIIISQLILSIAVCQTDTGSIRALETLIRQQHPDGTIFYTDKIDSAIILRIKQSLKGRRFINQAISGVYDTIYLTKKEKLHLDSNINSLFSFTWKDNLFQNSKRLPKDSMWARITYEMKKTQALIKSDTAKASIRKHLDEMYKNANTFQFSPLIYFRNKSLFLVYILRFCGGDCGVEELTFYKFQDGKYKTHIRVIRAAF